MLSTSRMSHLLHVPLCRQDTCCVSLSLEPINKYDAAWTQLDLVRLQDFPPVHVLPAHRGLQPVCLSLLCCQV